MSKSIEDATNPVVRVDLTEHVRYGELFSEVESISAEILTINTNTGTFRCRLYDTGKFLYGNVDLMVFIVKLYFLKYLYSESIASLFTLRERD